MERYDEIVRMWRGFAVHSAAELTMRLDNFRILFAYHSGRIENEEITYHDTREIFENGKVLHFTGSPRTLFEQQNQKLCYGFLLDKIVAREPLCVALVLEVHAVLTGGAYDERRYIENGERPGTFKKHDYITGRLEVGSAPEDVERDVAALLAEINDYDGAETLKHTVQIRTRPNGLHWRSAAFSSVDVAPATPPSSALHPIQCRPFGSFGVLRAASGGRARRTKKAYRAVFRLRTTQLCRRLRPLKPGSDSHGMLEAAAYFHLCFENIHPFADGNGRVGRTLLNYYLLTHDHPPLIIYDEDKPDYYAALERYDAEEDVAPMLAFLRRETVKTWEKTLRR